MVDLKAIAKKVRKALKDDEAIIDLESFDQDIPVFPTGCMSVDLASGVMGIPQGIVVEVFSPEGLGKTTFVLTMIAAFQRKYKEEGVAAFIDAEQAMDMPYAEELGVDFKNLLFSQPDSLEQATAIVQGIMKAKDDDTPCLIAVDSMASLAPEAEIEGGMEKNSVALQARLFSKFFRITKVKRHSTTLICINQLREKVGMVWGNPNMTPGGRALKFYSSMRIELSSKGKIKDGNAVIGHKVKARFVKNKKAPPYQEAIFQIIFGEGIDKDDDLVGCGIDYGTIEQSGKSYEFKDVKASGRAKFVKKLKKEKMMKKLRKAIRKAYYE